MSGKPVFAAVSGFVAGSAVTLLAVAAYLHLFQSSKGEKLDDESTTATESITTSSRSPPPKVASAAAPLVPTALADGIQRVSFLSDIVAQLWPHIRKAASDTIRDSVEPMFAEMMPGPLKSLHFTKVDLGAVPIRMDNIVVHESKKDSLQFDMDFIWHTDCDIQLKADYLGSFGIKGLSLSGRLAFLLKPLTDVLPCVSAIQCAFINPPTIELDFTGLAQVADFSVVDKTIRSIIQQSLSSMMVLPNRMSYKLDAACNVLQTYQPPIGIARITLIQGHGFVAENRTFQKDDIPDIYCKIQIGDRSIRTQTATNALEPVWRESADFILSDYDQIVHLEAHDEDKLGSDDFLGSAQLTVGELLLSGKKSATVELLQTDKKATGAFLTFDCDVLTLTPSVSSLEDKSNDNGNQISGIMFIFVKQAFNLPVPKNEANSFVKVTCGANEFVTATVADYPGVDALNPIFDAAFQCVITSEMLEALKASGVVFKLLNGATELGMLQVTHTSLFDSLDMTVATREDIGEDGASLDFSVSVRGLECSASQATQVGRSDATKEVIPDTSNPIADATSGPQTVRITVVKGHGFKDEKRRLRRRDIPDPYCKIRYGSSPRVWRTSTIRDSNTPEWNESSEFPFLDPSQVIGIETYDEDKTRSDDELGNARVSVGKVLLAGGTLDVELQEKGAGNGCFITIRCELIQN